MELTKNDLMTARDYIYELSQTILRLNTIYNQEISNKRVKYWIKNRYSVSYAFASYKRHILRIYDYENDLAIEVEGEKDTIDFSNLFEQLYKKIENNEWEKDE